MDDSRDIQHDWYSDIRIVLVFYRHSEPDIVPAWAPVVRQIVRDPLCPLREELPIEGLRLADKVPEFFALSLYRGMVLENVTHRG